MQNKIRFTKHTADIRMEITAPGLESLFTTALEGMVKFMGPVDVSEKNFKEKSFQVSPGDPAILLVDFLSEMLTRMYIHKCTYHAGKVEVGDGRLKVLGISGRRVKGFIKEIKAVTYHEAKVRQMKQGKWSAHIIFDI